MLDVGFGASSSHWDGFVAGGAVLCDAMRNNQMLDALNRFVAARLAVWFRVGRGIAELRPRKQKLELVPAERSEICLGRLDHYEYCIAFSHC